MYLLGHLFLQRGFRAPCATQQDPHPLQAPSVGVTEKMKSVVLLPQLVRDSVAPQAARSPSARKEAALEARQKDEESAAGSPWAPWLGSSPQEQAATGSAGAAGDRQHALPGSAAADFGSRQTAR